MSTDPQASPWQREIGVRTHLSPGARITLSVAFLLFIAGGILFGYIFFSAISDRLSQPLNPVSAAVPVLPDNTSSAPVANTQPGASTNPAASVPTDRERVTILLLGIDQRESEAGQPTRTDTMILLTVDPVAKTMGMLTIPRDLWVPIPGLSKPLDERINTAHFYGDLYKYPGGGPVLAKKTVQYNLGIPVNYYVRIDFKGFEKIVDALGGVNINVDKAIYDDAYPDGNYGTITLNIPAGLQHMDGVTALQFVRTRHADSDFGRTRRQLQFLLAMRDQALKLNILPKVPSLISQFRDSVKTDLSASELLSLARTASQIDSDHIIARSIDEKMTTGWVTPQGGDVLIPKRDAIKAVVEEVFGSAAQPTVQPTAAPTVAPVVRTTPVQNAQTRSLLVSEGARIEVLNGTTSKGIAGRAQIYLNGLGYNVPKIGDAGITTYTDTVILYYSTKPYALAGLTQLFNVKPENVRQAPTARSDVDIRVVLGSSAVVP